MSDSHALSFDTEVLPRRSSTLEGRDRGTRDHREQQARRQPAHDTSRSAPDDQLYYESDDHEFDRLA